MRLVNVKHRMVRKLTSQTVTQPSILDPKPNTLLSSDEGSKQVRKQNSKPEILTTDIPTIGGRIRN